MGFINRNIVALVMVPSIVGLHYGWSELQDNTNLVPDGTRIEQPIYSIVKRSWAYVTNATAHPETTASSTQK